MFATILLLLQAVLGLRKHLKKVFVVSVTHLTGRV